MGGLIRFIGEHERGGLDVIGLYANYLTGSNRYKLYRELMEDEHNPINLKLLIRLPSDGFSKARINQIVLFSKGWGNLPGIREDYELFNDDAFPENYQGIEIPEELIENFNESGLIALIESEKKESKTTQRRISFPHYAGD